MKNSKMSLDAFKANAEKENIEIAMDTIQGGNLFDCHGKWGQRGKVAGRFLEKRIDVILTVATVELMSK